MLDCDHIFCLQCLLDFYNDAIKEGNLSTVKCLSPNCAKERAASQAKTTGKQKKPKTSLSPSELLQIGLTDETVKRYVALKYKTELESDKNTVYCPRQWCNGAARSKKHKKPEGLELNEVSDGESETEDNNDGADDDEKAGEKKPLKFDRGELLSICEDCGFAFCSRCFQSWHGELKICHPRTKDGELTEDQKASLEYIRLHTSPCPTCDAPAQKTHGCNHMICSRCQTHFCYLCSAWLDPANPYMHYNTVPGGKVTSCYMRLWELEEGDGDDVGIEYGGGRARQEANNPPPPAVRAPAAEVVEDFDFGGGAGGGEEAARAVPQRNRREEPVAVAREAPLVLRLFDNEQPQVAQPAVPPAAPDVPPAGGRGQNAPNRGGGAPARGRGRGGRGAGRGGGRGRRQGQEPQRPPEAAGNAEAIQQEGLDAAQQAWVRHFVQMALLDAEDEIEGGSDDDDDNFLIR